MAKGKRLMNREELDSDMERSIVDNVERGKVLDGMIGYILQSTQASTLLSFFTA